MRLRITMPLKLTGATGGEPSIITAPMGDVFVSGPQGIPSGANGSGGVGVWASHDDGASFGPAKLLGSDLGGGDSDLVYSKGAEYLIDLEAAGHRSARAPIAARPSRASGRRPTPTGARRPTAARPAPPTTGSG